MVENIDNKEIYVDVPSIRNFNSNLVLKNNEIVEILDDMIEDFKELDKKFNSTAGAKYKDKILLFLQESRDKIDNSNKNLTDTITKTAKIYEDAFNDVKKTVA